FVTQYRGLRPKALSVPAFRARGPGSQALRKPAGSDARCSKPSCVTPALREELPRRLRLREFLKPSSPPSRAPAPGSRVRVHAARSWFADCGGPRCTVVRGTEAASQAAECRVMTTSGRGR